MCQNTGDKRIPSMHVRWRQRIKKPLKSVWNVRETATANLSWPWIRESNTNARHVTKFARFTAHICPLAFQPTFLSEVPEEDTPLPFMSCRF